MKLPVQSINDLQVVKEQHFPILAARLEKTPGKEQYQVMVCAGTGCTSSRSGKLQQALKQELSKQNLGDQVLVAQTGCFGFCELGPIMVVYPDQIFYCQVKEEDIQELVEQQFVRHQPLERLLYTSPETGELQRTMVENEFFHPQMRVVLSNCGLINPEDIGEYVAMEGYSALAEVLTNKKPEEIVEIVTKSGLRGRGGGGFPTGRKWQFTAQAQDDRKYVVCNADEGDPGAFMDRSILEGDPHAVLEAMVIAGYAIGAEQGYIYVRAEYPIAVHRLEIAIEQAKELGVLGKNILNSGFDFEVEIRLGAGAFVCGEETALMRSVLGGRGEPRPRPPYPAVSGLWDKPTLINNVETFANIPRIIRKGWEWYAGLGTETSKGTKIFSLAGKINNTGLIEVPMGTTLRSIIFDIGGGIPGGKHFKAVQTGGPSGGCLPDSLLDTSVDYDSLTAIGSMMGSGGLIVMDETDCMVDIARFYLEFTQDESCGKCTPCRVGTKRLREILERITDGKGEMEDLDILHDLSVDIEEASLCGLGQTAPNPVLSSLRYFRGEYEAHIRDKHCPAGVCKALANIRIQPEKCKKCSLCAKVCPVKAITGEVKKTPYEINPELCIKCGACMEKCPTDAITKG